MSSIGRRFASLTLGAKLAWLSAGLSAIFVTATLIPLSVSTRQTTRQLIATELRQTQQVLLENQQRELSRLEYTAKLIAQNSTIIASIAEDRTQRQAGVHRGLNPALAITVQHALEDELPRIRRDLVVITDDSGRAFAAASRFPTSIGASTDLSSLHAVHVALDPYMPADTGIYGVIDLDSTAYSVAAVPLVTGDRTLGTILLGQRIDSSYVTSMRGALGGDVVVTSGQKLLAATNHALSPADIGRLASTMAAGAEQSTIALDGRDMVVAHLPLGDDRGGSPVTLWLLQPVSQLSATVTRPLVVQFVLYGLIAVILSGVGAAIVAQSVLRPLNRFIENMRVGPVDAAPSVRAAAGDESPEIKTLDRSFTALMTSLADEREQLEHRTVELAEANTVLRTEIEERRRVEAALSESEAQLRQSQKLEAIGTLAGGVAHDFNNLLTVITGYTQLAMMRMSKTDSLRGDLGQVVEASDRAARLTHQLLAFSRKQVLQPTVIDLGAVVDGVAPMLTRLIGEHIEIRYEHDTPLSRTIADRGQLEQVLINLVVNARDAMPRGGTLTIRTANATVKGEQRVLLSVSDTGVGIPLESRDRIFEPFFTTKEMGKGTGLGLSMVYGIVKQSGGTVELESELGKGTTFTILLPPGGTQQTVDAEPEESLMLPRGTETILVIEDEADVRELARRTLESLGYTVIASANVGDALAGGQNCHIDLALSDIVMPVMSGPQVIEQLSGAGIHPVIVYMSGYADDALEKYELDAGASFLRKPFAPSDLARVIRDALDGAPARAGR